MQIYNVREADLKKINLTGPKEYPPLYHARLGLDYNAQIAKNCHHTWAGTMVMTYPLAYWVVCGVVDRLGNRDNTSTLKASRAGACYTLRL
jgi:hypothetical protein